MAGFVLDHQVVYILSSDPQGSLELCTAQTQTALCNCTYARLQFALTIVYLISLQERPRAGAVCCLKISPRLFARRLNSVPARFCTIRKKFLYILCHGLKL